MIRDIFFKFLLIVVLASCSKEKVENITSLEESPYEVYQEGLEAWEKNDFFFASKKFSEAEILFEDPQQAAHAAVMASYSLYAINFYDEALESIDRFLKLYPVDKKISYIQYLKALIYYEQISDEKRDIDPLIKANDQIDFFLKKYPNSDYASDLKFKKDLIRNQLAAKEIFVAKYYIEVQKWVPAINRLKIVLSDYDETVFVEEALHRLVEIHYHIGLVDEAKRYAAILGYNYNSGEWFEKSYKILNKNFKKKKKEKPKEKNNFLKEIYKKISNVRK